MSQEIQPLVDQDAFELVQEDTSDTTPASPLHSPSLMQQPRLVRQNSNDFIVLKVESLDADGCRRFAVETPPQSAAYATLKASIQGAFPSLVHQAFHLRFVDDEGDECIISNNLELAEAVQHTVREQAKSLRVKVALVKQLALPSAALTHEVKHSPTATLAAPDLAKALPLPEVVAKPAPATPLAASSSLAKSQKDAAKPSVHLPAATRPKVVLAPAARLSSNLTAVAELLALQSPRPTAIFRPRGVIHPTSHVTAQAVPRKVSAPAGASAPLLTCSHCKASPLQGVRYSCTRCPDYALCSSCESKDVHPATHPLIKTKLAAAKPTARTDIHHHATCDGCGASPIQGVRFKCQVCPNFDLCATCEKKNIHPADHAMYKLRVNMAARVAASSSRPSNPLFGRKAMGGQGDGRCRQSWPSCPFAFQVGKILLFLVLVSLFGGIAKPLALMAVGSRLKPGRGQACGVFSRPCSLLTFFVLSWIFGGYCVGGLAMLALYGASLCCKQQPHCQPASRRSGGPRRFRGFGAGPFRFSPPKWTSFVVQSVAPQVPQPAVPQPHVARAAQAAPSVSGPQAVCNSSEVDAAVFAEQLETLRQMGFQDQEKNVLLLKQFAGNLGPVVNSYMDHPQSLRA